MVKLRDHPAKKEVKHVICKECQGKGAKFHIRQKTEPCITCRGTGKVNGSKCFVCGGAGTQTVTRNQLIVCTECEGSGWVTEEPDYAYA